MIIKYDLYSSSLERDVTIHMYLPDDYMNSHKTYPVLYMFDGHNLFFDEDATYGRSWRLLNHLYALEEDIIVVGIECSHEGNERLSEYAPFDFYDAEFGGGIDGKGDATMDFILHTLKPYVDHHFPARKDRRHTWIGGSSCGGLMAIYALCTCSSVFSKAVALSPYVLPCDSSLLYCADQVYIHSPSSLYLSWGAREGNTAHEFVGETACLTELANILLSKGVRMEFHVKPLGEHDEAEWESLVDSFLRFLVS